MIKTVSYAFNIRSYVSHLSDALQNIYLSCKRTKASGTRRLCYISMIIDTLNHSLLHVFKNHPSVKWLAAYGLLSFCSIGKVCSKAFFALYIFNSSSIITEGLKLGGKDRGGNSLNDSAKTPTPSMPM